MEVIQRDDNLTSYLHLAAAAMATASRQASLSPSALPQHAVHLSAGWSDASVPMYICSRRGSFRRQETGAACARISYASKSSRARRIHVPLARRRKIPAEKKKKKEEKAAMKEFGSPLLAGGPTGWNDQNTLIIHHKVKIP